MLVLGRERGGEIHIGDDVTIKVLRIRGSQVSIGIQAPRGVKVVRGELKRKKRQGSGDDNSEDMPTEPRRWQPTENSG